MSHFEIGDWVDYVRGIAKGPEAAAMGEHLKSECSDCAETFKWLTQVSETASSSSVAAVPEKLVERAQNLFEKVPEFNFDSLFALSARLVVDAGRTQFTVGIRTGSTVDHALYEAGHYTIDLRQESSRGSSQVSLIGQISSSDGLDRAEPRFPVALFSGESILSTTVSNRFGEFSLTYTRRPRLTLTIGVVETGRRIDIPLVRTGSVHK